MIDKDVDSYEKVNYLLRLRKQIERKMIIEMMQKLSKEISINEYHYLGFGSVYFADFILFHKYLHINNMTSLEKDRKKKKRFEFNLPYKFINLEMKSSSEYLRKKINWKSNPLFLWLDYDCFIDFDVIEDLKYIAKNSKPKDILLITVDADCPEKLEDLEQFLKDYRKYIGSDITVKKAKEDFPQVLLRIVDSAINQGKNLRISTDKIKISQLLNLTYKDTSRMYTYGCLFERPDSSIVKECDLKKLDFISTGKDVFKIDCPLLTPKEKFHLDSGITKNKECMDIEKKTGLKKSIINKYSIFYKYYPQYFESIY